MVGAGLAVPGALVLIGFSVSVDVAAGPALTSPTGLCVRRGDCAASLIPVAVGIAYGFGRLRRSSANILGNTVSGTSTNRGSS